MDAELLVEVNGDEIRVTRPGTDYAITFKKSGTAPNFELAHSWTALEATTPESSEFRAQAFQAAVETARELGWID